MKATKVVWGEVVSSRVPLSIRKMKRAGSRTGRSGFLLRRGFLGQGSGFDVELVVFVPRYVDLPTPQDEKEECAWKECGERYCIPYAQELGRTEWNGI